MDAPLESMQALRDALVDEYDKLNGSNKPVDCFPPVIANDPLINFRPVIHNVSEVVF